MPGERGRRARGGGRGSSRGGRGRGGRGRGGGRGRRRGGGLQPGHVGGVEGQNPAARRVLFNNDSADCLPGSVSFDDELRLIRAARARDNANLKKLTKTQLDTFKQLRDQKKVRYSMMPDAPTPTRKRKKASPPRHPCILMPGVPDVPPARVPRPWELPGPSCDIQPETTSIMDEDDGADVIEGTPLPSPVSISRQYLISKTVEPADEDLAIQASETPTSKIVEPAVESTSSAEEDQQTPVQKKRKISAIQASETPTSKIVEPAVESTSSAEEDQQTPVQKKRIISRIDLAIQASETPTSTVDAEIELIGFTPTSSITEAATSPFLPENYEDFLELEGLAGSDVDDDHDIDLNQEDFVNNRVRSRTVNEFPVLDEEELGRDIYLATLALDAEDDAALRKMVLDPSYLRFEWLADPEAFDGLREVFIEDTGPTFSLQGLSPLDVFKKIWDEDVMAKIVLETNRYANQLVTKLSARQQENNPNRKSRSRLIRWKDVTIDELWTFFAIIMAQSVTPCVVEREFWYPKLDIFKIGNYNNIMSYDRFALIKKCLHFVDSSRVPQVPHKLDKILPIIHHLNQKFVSLYVPEQNISLDESLLLWKGRLSFSQMIKNKRAQVGIKTYEICESRTGYLWKMDLYAGKSESHSIDVERHNIGEQPDVELEGATSQIVLKLMKPLLNNGYTLVMDNFYNSPLLTRILKKQYRTDTMGTLRLNREFLPNSLKTKKKTDMRVGEICSSCTNDMSVVVWRDSNLVTMISSFQPVAVGGKEKHGVYKYRPQVVLDYNKAMGGVDKKDQMLHAYPVERVRNHIWYKKLFRRLINVSIHNALVIYRYRVDITNRDFRIQLLDEILKRHQNTVVKCRAETLPPAPATHVSIKGTKWQRCKLCAQKKLRKTTRWTCKACQVHLCTEPCFEDYHK